MDARTRIGPLKQKKQSLTGSKLITYVSFINTSNPQAEDKRNCTRDFLTAHEKDLLDYFTFQVSRKSVENFHVKSLANWIRRDRIF